MRAIDDIQQEIAEECRVLESWPEKYRYLIEQGKQLPQMSPDLRTDDNLVRGCQVRAWFRAEFKQGKVWYHIDSDSLVVRGVIALLIRVMSGQDPAEIEKAQLFFIDRIGLSESFFPTDPSNLQKIVEQMKAAARQFK